MRQIGSTIKAYLELTKPSIMLLVVFTGAAALVVEGSLLVQPGRLVLVLLGLFLTGGSGCHRRPMEVSLGAA